MVLEVPSRFHTASYAAIAWVEVWRGDEPLSMDATFSEGSVSDTWVTSGVRRTLSLTVPRTDDWLRWLTIGVEIRPYKGMKLNSDDIICPMGRYPVKKFTRPRSPSQITVQAQDRWSLVTIAPMPTTKIYSGLISEVASQLIAEVDPYGFGETRVNTATSRAETQPGVWQGGDRGKVVGDLVASIGAEAFVDALGAPLIRDRPIVGDPVISIREGDEGVLIDLVGEIDWESVRNFVTVEDTSNGSTLDPVFLGINDPDDPAHRSNISGGTQSGGWQSEVVQAQFENTAQMIQAGTAVLYKGAAPAKQWSVRIPPDVSLEASDTVLLETLDGDELGQIQSIQHPLTSDKDSSLTVSSAREL